VPGSRGSLRLPRKTDNQGTGSHFPLLNKVDPWFPGKRRLWERFEGSGTAALKESPLALPRRIPDGSSYQTLYLSQHVVSHSTKRGTQVRLVGRTQFSKPLVGVPHTYENGRETQRTRRASTRNSQTKELNGMGKNPSRIGADSSEVGRKRTKVGA